MEDCPETFRYGSFSVLRHCSSVDLVPLPRMSIRSKLKSTVCKRNPVRHTARSLSKVGARGTLSRGVF